jgi:uncharacterized protein YoxC
MGMMIGSKFILGENNIAIIFLPREVAIVKKLLSHAQIVEKDLGPTMASIGKETTKLECKAHALVNNIQDKVLTLEKERHKMEPL